MIPKLGKQKASPATPRAGFEQAELNRAVYESARVYRYYVSDKLLPSEEACFQKYRDDITGRDLLDVGVGAGRTTLHLKNIARRYEAVDYSSVMVSYLRKRMPETSVTQADFRDLHSFQDNSFDFLLAASNMIDALTHDGRLSALAEAYRVLRPGGLFAFSSHNRNYKNRGEGPRMRWTMHPAKLVYRTGEYIFSWYNYFRLASLRSSNTDYALLNDAGHHFACLHYYATRAVVEAQLAAAGFHTVDLLDPNGVTVARGADDTSYSSLFYVARRNLARL